MDATENGGVATKGVPIENVNSGTGIGRMHRQRSTWKWLAALIGVAMVGSWCPEALGQAEKQQGETEKEIRPQPLKSAPLKAPSQGPVEQMSKVSDDKVGIIMPELIDGFMPLLKAIGYPASARMNGIQGIVVISFVVNEQGGVEQAVVEQGIGGGCDEEALRVIRQARFKPAIQVERTPDGDLARKPVKVPMSLPITFRLK